MLARLTEQGVLVLPQAVLQEVGNPTHFRIQISDGQLILTPETPQILERVATHIEALGISQQDVSDAIEWARNN